MKIRINQVWDLVELMQPSAQSIKSALDDYTDPVTWLRENDYQVDQHFCHQDPNGSRIEIECTAHVPDPVGTWMLMRWPHLTVAEI